MCPTADSEGARRGVPPTSERLETERLAIRRFADSDLEPFLAYRNDPEVAATNPGTRAPSAKRPQ